MLAPTAVPAHSADYDRSIASLVAAFIADPWLPPGVAPDEQALGAVMQEGVARGLQEEVFGVLELVGAGHPQEAHWYLPAIGQIQAESSPAITPMFRAAR